MRKYDEILEDVRDKDHMLQQMVAELHLCERLGKSKETLINELLASKLR